MSALLGLVEAFDAVYGASAGALNAVWLLSGNPADVVVTAGLEAGRQAALATLRP